MEINTLTSKIIGLAIEVHRDLGPGLLEKTYEECLCIELENHCIKYESQKLVPIVYKGKEIKDAYRIDILVEDKVIIELKAVEKLIGFIKHSCLHILNYQKKKLAY